MKDDVTFQEAYLLPIPYVSVDFEADNKNYSLPVGQPTAIARVHTSIDCAIAEPTEHSPLISR